MKTKSTRRWRRGASARARNPYFLNARHRRHLEVESDDERDALQRNNLKVPVSHAEFVIGCGGRCLCWWGGGQWGVRARWQERLNSLNFTSEFSFVFKTIVALGPLFRALGGISSETYSFP
jgi:hypothetical protein